MVKLDAERESGTLRRQKEKDSFASVSPPNPYREKKSVCSDESLKEERGFVTEK